MDAEVDEIAYYMRKMEENGELNNLENNSDTHWASLGASYPNPSSLPTGKPVGSRTCNGHDLSFVDALFIILDPRTRASLRVNINDIKNSELSTRR